MLLTATAAAATTAAADNEPAAGGAKLDKGGDVSYRALRSERSGGRRRWQALTSIST